MCAGGGAATIGYERIHWRTKRTREVRNRTGDISTRSARAIGSALAASLVFAAPAGAAAPNTWGTVGSLTSARALAASAVLPGGNVLVAGGTGANVLSSSEIFDPATDTWSPRPAMSTPRVGAVAVTLADGDVFVAGGSSSVGDAGALNTAEVYDPTQGTFTPVSNTMASSRFLPAAALLPDGDVLVVGGQDQNGDALSTADLYDPATDSFRSGARAPTDMTTGRSLPVAATRDNGDVLVAGGADSSNAPLDTAEVYDPSSNSWTPTANTLSTPRLGGGIAPLPDGRELLVGGESAGLPVQATTATTDFYSPSTNSFTPGPAMATPRFLFGIDALHDGRVLVAGGAATSNGSTTILSGVEIFDPATDQWSATAPLPRPLAELATDVLPEGQVLAAGGTTTVSLTDASTQALLYTPASVPTAPLAVTLRPSRNLVGGPSRVKVQLVIVGYDAAGSRSTTTRTITVRR
jgi:N-acetylneuraminic acid mutarotase